MPKQLKVLFVATVILVLGLSAQGTVASWRVNNEIDAGAMTTGSLKLMLAAGGQSSGTLNFSQLDDTNLWPGKFSQAPLEVLNSGSVDLSYNLVDAVSAPANATAADRSLAEQSLLSIYAGMNPKDCAADAALTGQLLYSGQIGSNAKFSQNRVLAAGTGASTSESLCVRVTLPSNASQQASGGRLSLVLRFVGQQS